MRRCFTAADELSWGKEKSGTVATRYTWHGQWLGQGQQQKFLLPFQTLSSFLKTGVITKKPFEPWRIDDEGDDDDDGYDDDDDGGHDNYDDNQHRRHKPQKI